MNYKDQIINTFKNSPVEQILIVDDAYDAPEIDQQFAGDLLGVLQGSPSKKLLSDDEIEAAENALNESDFEHEAISKAMDKLYREYCKSRNSDLDPNDLFKNGKGTALQSLAPLLKLLKCCGDHLDIYMIGTNNVRENCKGLKPDLIFMDFFLSPPENEDMNSGQEESTKVLREILSMDIHPAVILMSSNENVVERAESYLHDLKGHVMALRFGYLRKEWITTTGGNLKAIADAADVLMDTAGSFEFGKTIEDALKIWKEGAKNALDQLYDDLHKFYVKDFAYLLKFRLYEEGDPFADYLEWFLGETLRAIVDDEVNWGNLAFTKLNREELTQAIEGAHPLPSDQIAKFFHRIRFNSREARVRKRVALGDLYIASNHIDVRMIISPDCDLVLRKNERPAAKRLLSIGGKVRSLSENHAIAGNLIFYNKLPKTIKWDKKDFMTHKFPRKSKLSDLEVNQTSYEYFSSMRPMFTQMIQKEALAELSRIGIATPPVVYVGAPVKVFLKKNGKNQATIDELKKLREPQAQVFMPRGGNETKMRALFSRNFVRDLMTSIEGLEEDHLLDHHRPHLKEFIRKKEEVRKSMLNTGLEIPKTDDDIFTVLHKRRKKSKNWLEIVIDISDDSLISS